MKKTLLLIFLIKFQLLFAQDTNERIKYSDVNFDIQIDANINLDETEELFLSIHNDSLEIYHESINFSDYIKINNLKAGNYSFSIYSLDSIQNRFHYFNKDFNLEKFQSKTIKIDLSYYESNIEIDSLTLGYLTDEITEFQISLSINHKNWFDLKSQINTNWNVNFTGYNWIPLTKHIGILAGGGFGLGQYYFKKNYSSFEENSKSKLYENYTYASLNMDLKFRLTFGNQKEINYNYPKFKLDFGILYNIPLYFRDVARFENNIRFTNGNLHQFTDFRSYINIGFSTMQLFLEYRIFDFVLGNYIELPKFNAGIKLIFTE
ncbi:MAG: hypothetical protein HYR91_13980 [Flavobacteriia bacterium]|nr:hypothetical protein [Flavobacteriia bacterium]